MMRDQIFQQNPLSRVHTPGARGVYAVCTAISTAATITATQQADDPVTYAQTGKQWLLCQTSGSTGRPKTIRRDPASWISSFEVTRKKFGISSQDTYAVLGSLGHSLGLYATLEALHLGADLCVVSGTEITRQWTKLADHGATVIYTTPTLLSHSTKTKKYLPDVRSVFVGGGNLSDDVLQQAQAQFPNATIRQFYGTSETSFITMTDDTTPSGSVGQPYPSVELRAGNNGQSEEVRVKSPYLAESYAGTSDTLNRDADGFVRTGELGYLDTNGNLHLQGRIDRMVTVNDINIHPEKVEEIIHKINTVADCAVIAIPDQTHGHQLICYAVPVAQDDPTLQIRQVCRDTCGAHGVPQKIILLPQLPLLKSGKPDLRQLTQMAGRA